MNKREVNTHIRLEGGVRLPSYYIGGINMNLDLIKLNIMNEDNSYILDKVNNCNFASDINTFINNYTCIRIYNYMYNIIKDIFDKGWDSYPVMYSSGKFISELYREYFKDFYIDENTVICNLALIIKLINEETLFEVNVISKENKIRYIKFLCSSEVYRYKKEPQILNINDELSVNENANEELDFVHEVYIATKIIAGKIQEDYLFGDICNLKLSSRKKNGKYYRYCDMNTEEFIDMVKEKTLRSFLTLRTIRAGVRLFNNENIEDAEIEVKKDVTRFRFYTEE